MRLDKWLPLGLAFMLLFMLAFAASACGIFGESKDLVWSSQVLPEGGGTPESPVLTEVLLRDGDGEGVVVQLKFDSSEVPEPLGKREFNPAVAFPTYEGHAKRRLATVLDVDTAFKIPTNPIEFENHPFVDQLRFELRNGKLSIVLDVFNDATEEFVLNPEQKTLDIVVHDCVEADCPPEWQR